MTIEYRAGARYSMVIEHRLRRCLLHIYTLAQKNYENSILIVVSSGDSPQHYDTAVNNELEVAEENYRPGQTALCFVGKLLQ